MDESPLSMSVSVEMTVQFAPYQTAKCFMSVSGVKSGMDHNDIESLADNEGRIAFSILKDRLLQQVRELKVTGHQSAALNPLTVSDGERDRNAKLYLRRNVGLDNEGFKTFRDSAGENYADIALAAEQAGITTFPALMDYVKAFDKAAA